MNPYYMVVSIVFRWTLPQSLIICGQYYYRLEIYSQYNTSDNVKRDLLVQTFKNYNDVSIHRISGRAIAEGINYETIS